MSDPPVSDTDSFPAVLSLCPYHFVQSGPVTAGILKGDKSRFQLFGDTVNTASRMESNGEANRIQISPETAALLVTAGKGNWLCKRDGMTGTFVFSNV